MRILKCVVQAIAPVACGALALSLLAGDAIAAKRPVLWPSGARLETYVDQVFGALHVYWPVANGADHYRLTVVVKVKGVYTVRTDSSPVYGTSAGLGGLSPGTYTITVTAYSDPDEAVAYSESLQAQISVR